MRKVVVDQFGDPSVLRVRELPTPKPGPGEALVKVTSVGMNHADLMARRGEYLISSGFPPFTPGIEAGGVIEAVGADVSDRTVGQRVILGANAPRRHTTDGTASPQLFGGTYTSHYLLPAALTVPAPAAIPDDQLGAVWLPYLTAWGCLIWKQRIKAGEYVAIPAASSGVALAAAQIAKREGAIPIGLTTSKAKAEQIEGLPESAYAHLVVTHDHHHQMRSWHRDLRRIARQNGIRMFFDPVASGRYLELEIHALGNHGTIWIYGLLGQPDKVDVTPLIRKRAAIRGWYLSELTEDEPSALAEGYRYILDGFEAGSFRQRIAGRYSMDEVVTAHEEFERGRHIGKFVIVPN